jgi:hypothetical protein
MRLDNSDVKRHSLKLINHRFNMIIERSKMLIQTRYQVKVDGLASVDDAVGDGGAVDDAAEHVDENGLNPRIINRL